MRRGEDEKTRRREDGGADEFGGQVELAGAHLSPRVRLEVAALEGDAAPFGSASAAAEEGARLTVLVVSGEVDLRRYVVECLRVRADVRAIEAATLVGARQLAVENAAALIIADEHSVEVIETRTDCRGIVLVDELPRDNAPLGWRVRFLARPFTARELLAAVSLLIG